MSGLNDPDRLDRATRILIRWSLASLAFTIALGTLMHLRVVDRDGSAVPWFLAFGWTHVVAGMTLAAGSRGRLLRQRPRVDEVAFLAFGMVAPIVGGCLVLFGTGMIALVARAVMLAG